jgi:tetratricopeptide (TPR) repeat protein
MADPAGGNKIDPARAATALAGKEPQKVWNEAFAHTLTKPELVADAAETLFDLKEYKHAAEALKAGLRHGRATGSWVQEALAVALQADGAAGPEVERVALSAIDLEPADPKAYLKAARTERDLGRYDVALAFCQRAADLEPNSPASYVEALGIADRSKDVTTDVALWALGQLLQRDWAADGTDYHAVAKDKAARLATKFVAAGDRQAAAKLQAVVTAEAAKTRDLVIELLWQGRADLDLTVTEPTGAVCSATHKRTTGGGVLKGDILEQLDDNRSEVYTAGSAFSGTYLVGVKVGLGQAVGNAARLKVTRFQGTPKESVEVISLDLSRPSPISITLDGGTRSDLATVPVEVSEARLETTLAPTVIPAGPTGGTSAARPSAMPSLSVAQPVIETKVPGIVAGLPGLRLEQKLSADRTKVEMSANPVFTGPAKDIPLPKLGLLPGGN